jgi:starch-binding outer membrane protein, SusD/RagB family
MKKINLTIILNSQFIYLFLFSILAGSCKKFVEVDTPSTKVSTENAYKDDYNAAAVLTGLYTQMSQAALGSVNLPATSLMEELSADNLALFDLNINGQLRSFYQNELDPTYQSSFELTYWTNVYNMMYNINSSVEGLKGNEFLTPAVRDRLLGETYFLRAFCYFYMVNLYGEVPLVLTTAYNDNSRLSRASVEEVYKQIESDLTEAENLLDYSYVSSDVTIRTNERVRPNLATVQALQARVYLYEKKYALSEEAATKVINQSTNYSLSSLSNSFLKNNNETIWALQPVSYNFNTKEAGTYIIPDNGPNYEHPVYASSSLINAFESGDRRRLEWIDSIITPNNNIFRYPAKYKIGFVDGSKTFDEYTIVFRLSELYLIRSEARNERGNSIDAIDDINIIRTRARAASTSQLPNPLPNLSVTLTPEQLRPLIIKERRVELFTEWGHRWFDLKRTNTIDAAMEIAEEYKGGTWLPYKALYPIPVKDILLNSNLTQNPGYTK